MFLALHLISFLFLQKTVEQPRGWHIKENAVKTAETLNMRKTHLSCHLLSPASSSQRHNPAPTSPFLPPPRALGSSCHHPLGKGPQLSSGNTNKDISCPRACSSSWAQALSLPLQPLHLHFHTCLLRPLLNQDGTQPVIPNAANSVTVSQRYYITLHHALQWGYCKGWHYTKGDSHFAEPQ